MITAARAVEALFPVMSRRGHEGNRTGHFILVTIISAFQLHKSIYIIDCLC